LLHNYFIHKSFARLKPTNFTTFKLSAEKWNWNTRYREKILRQDIIALEIDF